ncbi:putative ribonuclease H-like domain-containing protein, partial [Tanacetum coccineum]
DSPFDLEAYTDSDYADASLDRKSITGGCQFLGSRLISWQCKKQTVVSNSTTEAEYVAAASIHLLLPMLVNAVEGDFINTSIEFWATSKAKTVNEEVQIQALVDGKKVIVTETKLERIGAKTTVWNKFSSTMASAIICLATNQRFNFSKYIFDNMVKNLEGGVKFLMYPSLRRNNQGGNRGKTLKPSGSIEPITDEAANEEHVPIHSNDPLLSGEDRLKLNELMEICTNLSKRVLDLENTKTTQAAIAKLKEREDASKQGRKIDNLYADAKVTLVNEAQERNDDNLMFDTGVFDEQEVEVEKVVSTAEVTTASATTTTVDELTLSQTLIEIKAAKPKAVTTAGTRTKTVVTRPKARGVVVQEPSEFTTTSQPSQLPHAKDKGNAKMIEPDKPLKKKDQILIDEEIAQKLQVQLNPELEEEEKLALC